MPLDHHQRYLVEEFAADYLARRMSRRDLLRRALQVTGSVPLTASVLFALGCGGSEPEATPTPPTAPPTPAPPPPPAGRGGAPGGGGSPTGRNTEETRAALLAYPAYLKGLPFVRAGALGATGFCFGGGMTWELVVNSPDIRAAAPYYGTAGAGFVRLAAPLR